MKLSRIYLSLLAVSSLAFVGCNKELLIIPDANHVDLYENMDIIPFDRIESFFRDILK